MASDPSDENIKLWLKYLDKKSRLAKQLQTKVRSYLQRNTGLKLHTKRKFQKILNKPVVNLKDGKRFRIRMYFKSTCPHCKRMMPVLRQLQRDGVFVEIHQLDKENFGSTSYPLAPMIANLEDVKKYDIRTVPFVMIADKKNKTASKPLTGFQSYNSIRNIMQKLKEKRDFNY